ncbi:MAG: glycosyltransferase family 39 protein [Bacteroidia bacterium]
MILRIKQLWNEKPLLLILLAGCFFRILAVIFSKGYGMHDDHFLVIEPAQSWVDGADYNSWLPFSHEPAMHPSGHSFFYTGLHFILFWLLKQIGVTDPQHKMYLVRFLHAVLSISIIYFGYKITEKIADQKRAKVVGILLALFWFMPFLSVRNLVEFVCIPPLMYATWLLLIASEKKFSFRTYLWIGFIVGIAFSIRFQSILFCGGFGLALLFQKKWKEAITLGIGFALCAAAIQGVVDSFVWHAPFVEFREYVRYNLAHSTSYNTQPWYNYFPLLTGILIPPISLALLFGFVKKWKTQLILFLPSFIFFAFHCYFPNKQERFIIPIIPFIIILGWVGWSEFQEKSAFWQKRPKLTRVCWIFFWSVNLLPLLVVSVSYSKRNRVEAMTYIAAKHDVRSIVIEDSDNDKFTMLPLFYLQKWGHVFFVTKKFPLDSLYKQTTELKNSPILPNYVVFMQKENIDARVATMKKYYPDLTYETTIQPSFIDWLLNYMNPVNNNQTTYIYHLEK